MWQTSVAPWTAAGSRVRRAGGGLRGAPTLPLYTRPTNFRPGARRAVWFGLVPTIDGFRRTKAWLTDTTRSCHNSAVSGPSRPLPASSSSTRWVGFTLFAGSACHYLHAWAYSTALVISSHPHPIPPTEPPLWHDTVEPWPKGPSAVWHSVPFGLCHTLHTCGFFTRVAPHNTYPLLIVWPPFHSIILPF